MASSGPNVALDEGAFLLCGYAHPELDLDAEMTQLDELASRCPTNSAAALVAHLFVVEGFQGNVGDYYDPRNSLMTDVLARRLGIPISLSVLAMSVAHRAGIELLGIGLPGHFIVRDAYDPDTYFDPFNGGRVLDVAGCHGLVKSMSTAAAPVPFDPRWVAPVGTRMILTRMLANLRTIYEKKRDIGALMWVLQLRCAMPDATDTDRRSLKSVAALLN